MVEKNARYGVIGLGAFGRSLAKTLHDLGYEVLAVDIDPEVVELALSENVATHVVTADVHNPHVLEELEMNQCSKVCVAIGTNLEASVLAVLNLIDLGVQYILAKSTSEVHARVLQRLGGKHGANQVTIDVIRPEVEMGVLAAQRLLNRSMVETVTLDPLHTFIEIDAPAETHGKTLKDCGIRSRYGALVVVVRRGESAIVAPDSSCTIKTGDRLVLLGESNVLRQLERR